MLVFKKSILLELGKCFRFPKTIVQIGICLTTGVGVGANIGINIGVTTGVAAKKT